jgi:hypothetical protein
LRISAPAEGWADESAETIKERFLALFNILRGLERVNRNSC